MSQLETFSNEPLLELRRSSNRKALDRALAEFDSQLPLQTAVVIAGSKRRGKELVSTDPCNFERIISHSAVASSDEIERALAQAVAGFKQWSAVTAKERATVLQCAAELMRNRRHQLVALLLREAGKPWADADAEVCEAIDFIEYYTRGALDLDAGITIHQAAGERNLLRYRPRGTVVAIAPWNFPLSIACGMVVGGLATGNAVVLKPAEQTPACAGVLVDILLEAGVPPKALALLPGGGEVGEQLVKDARVHTIAFTGSVPVGMRINQIAAQLADGQGHVKRLIAEMGGKNCITVDSTADLDDAVPEIVKSAYKFAGQKCSATSRVLVHRNVYDYFLERLQGAVKTLLVGPADNWDSDVPALIEQTAQKRVLDYLTTAEHDGCVVTRTEAPSGGWFVPASVVADLTDSSPILSDEIFGPLLAVQRVDSIERAMEKIDQLPFALTGALFTRDPAVSRKVEAWSPVGNLYINRGTTGALVGRHPFGGNRLSGNGSKAGGPHYLLQFVEPRAVSENTMRHGLVL